MISAFLRIGCLVLALALTSRAQTSPALPVEAAPLWRMTERLEAADRALQKNVSAFLALVESEKRAGSISEIIADRLLMEGRSVLPPISGNARALLAAMRVPAENPVVLRALKDAEVSALETQIQRDKLLAGAVAEMRERVRQLLFAARGPSDVEPFIALAARLEAVAEAHSIFEGTAVAAQTFAGFKTFLRAFAAAIDPDMRDAAKAGAVFSRDDRFVGDVEIDWAGEVELASFKERILAPWTAALETERWALLTALAQKKPAAEIYETVRRLGEAGQAHGSIFASNPWGGISPTEARMAAIANALDDPWAAWVDHDIAGLVLLRYYGANRREAPFFAEEKRILLEWQRQRPVTIAKAEKRDRDNLVARIRAASRSADLDALQSELEALFFKEELRKSPGTATSRNTDASQALSQLRRLRSEVEARNFSALFGPSASFGGEANWEIERAIGDLREKMVREAFSRVLKAPELNQPPFLELPIDAAVESLCDSAAAAGQWPRVLRILETQNSPGFVGQIQQSDKAAVASVRFYLAGLNFELGEQWADAVKSYQKVLAAALPRTPIHEAAERLKLLRQSHPASPALP